MSSRSSRRSPRPASNELSRRARPERYRVILCDVWGVRPRWREALSRRRRTAACSGGARGGSSSSSPTPREPPRRSSSSSERLGLPRDAWDGIATSGEAGIAALKLLGRPVGFLGTASDRAVLEGRGVAIADGDDFTDLACTGLDGARPDVDDYRPRSRALGGARRAHALPQSRPAGDPRRRSRGRAPARSPTSTRRLAAG